MGEAAVRDILDRIEQLSDVDRNLLEKRLAQREEREWQQEIAKARDRAREQNIDEAEIDRVIENLRHPPTTEPR